MTQDHRPSPKTPADELPLAVYLRQKREEAGLSQRRLAVLGAISQTSLSQFERGVSSALANSTVRGLLEAMDAPIPQELLTSSSASGSCYCMCSDPNCILSHIEFRSPSGEILLRPRLVKVARSCFDNDGMPICPECSADLLNSCPVCAAELRPGAYCRKCKSLLMPTDGGELTEADLCDRRRERAYLMQFAEPTSYE